MKPTKTLCYRLIYGEPFNINSTQSSWVIPTDGYTDFTIQARSSTGTFATAVITVRRSNDGVPANARALESALTIGPGEGQTAMRSCVGIKNLVPQCTTAEGSAAYVDLFVTLYALDS